MSIPVTIYITDHPTPESPLAPAAPTVRGSGTESLAVSWGQPSNAGRPAISGYDLRYREGTSGSWIDGPQDVTETSAQLTGLVENTAYEAQVRAQNADGEGPWSPAGTGTTVASATRSIEENLGSDTDTSARNVGDPVAATDADSGDTLTYSLEGTDAAKFDIDSSTGQIKTKVGQNYDHEGDGTLSVTVSVTGGLDTVSIPVTIYITDHPTPEPPLAPAAPTVRGSARRASWCAGARRSRAGGPAIDRLRPPLPRGDERTLDRRSAGRDGDVDTDHGPRRGHGVPGAGACAERGRRQPVVPRREPGRPTIRARPAACCW